MRFVKADYEKEWFFALLLQVLHRLLREVSPRHVGIHRAEGSASAVEPNAGRISKWFPKGLDFNARGQRGLAFRSQPLLVLFGIDSQVETVFEIAVEVHLADCRGIVAVGLQDLCQSNLIRRESARELGDANRARVTTGKEGLARSGADR